MKMQLHQSVGDYNKRIYPRLVWVVLEVNVYRGELEQRLGFGYSHVYLIDHAIYKGTAMGFFHASFIPRTFHLSNRLFCHLHLLPLLCCYSKD